MGGNNTQNTQDPIEGGIPYLLLLFLTYTEYYAFILFQVFKVLSSKHMDRF